MSIQSTNNDPPNDNNISIPSHISDADLSYHPCSSQSADPPEESFDQSVNSQTHDISTDPTIIQLKQTLLSFNTRINTIETSNNHRFTDIERQIELCRLETQQQIQLSQASLTSLFTEGFKNLTLQVTDQIKKSTSPPTPTSPTIIQSTSIDPPTIPETPTKEYKPSSHPPPTTSTKSPDPPEIITPVNRVRNPYSTTFSTPIPTVHTPPTTVTIPTPQNTILPPTPTIVVQPAP